MIKSVTYLSEDKKSYELSDESDIQTLDTSVAEGSVARVTGKITAEYELRGGNWVKTAGGSGGGSNVMRVTFSDSDNQVVSDKEFSDVYSALQNEMFVYAIYYGLVGYDIFYPVSVDEGNIRFSYCRVVNGPLGNYVDEHSIVFTADNTSTYTTTKYPQAT
jgi:hypothetical protein